jgi:hypothetical protein
MPDRVLIVQRQSEKLVFGGLFIQHRMVLLLKMRELSTQHILQLCNAIYDDRVSFNYFFYQYE